MQTVDRGGLSTVGFYFHPTEAHVAAGLLDSDGVPRFLHGIHHGSLDWMVCRALGGIRLQVPEHLAGRASELLSAEFPGLEPDLGPCPGCGANEWTLHTTWWRLTVLVLHCLAIPLPWEGALRHCESCGLDDEPLPPGDS